uniref:Uncharacterized protein n=1 Tax=Arundo donax TaxID=35708 RepID=A0A0A9AAJ3_ARUDO
MHKQFQECHDENKKITVYIYLTERSCLQSSAGHLHFRLQALQLLKQLEKNMGSLC